MVHIVFTWIDGKKTLVEVFDTLQEAQEYAYNMLVPTYIDTRYE